jgi:ribosomal-protein-alanine N-acetyltransferase
VESNTINFIDLQQSLLKTEIPKDRLSQQLNSGIPVNLSNGKQVLLRWMSFSDIPGVLDLERRIFPSPWVYESFAYELTNRNYNISMVGVIGNQVIAYNVTYLVVDEIHISNIAVSPAFRRLKIGETLLWISLEIGKSSDCQFAHLEVRKNNIAAISLYKRYGFQIIGLRKNYYENEKEDALLMSLNLESEIKHGLVQTK